MKHRLVAAVLCCLCLASSPAGAVPSDGARSAGHKAARQPLGATDWLPRALDAVARGEYAPSWQPAPGNGLAPGWQAPNRAQGLRFGFAAQGLSVRPRVGSTSAAPWTLAVTAAASAPAGPPRVTAAGDEVIVAWPEHTVTYANGPDGLLLELVLPEGPLEACAPDRSTAPEAKGGGEARCALLIDFRGPITVHRAGPGALEIRRSGHVEARFELQGAVDDAGGRVQTQLAALARGPAGRSAFTVALPTDTGTRPLRLLARIAGAQPLPTWRYASGQPGAALAFAAATAGDVNGDGYSDVILGAPGYDTGQPSAGGVFVFHGSPSGPSTIPSWTARGSLSGSMFGSAVATAGDVNGDGYADVIVGAPSMSVEPGPQVMGAAYLWLGSSAGLGPDGTPANADWARPGYSLESHFGLSVATAGDVDGDGYSDVLIGAPGRTDPVPDHGWVYLYRGSALGPTDAVAWLKQGEAAGDGFGWSVATAGDVNGDGYADVAIGAPLASLGGYSGNGGVYAFLGSRNGLAGTPHLTWGPEDDGAGAGLRVATAGDVDGDGYAELLVAAPMYGSDGHNVGAVFLFDATFAGLGGVPAWSAVGDGHGHLFGNAVAGAGDVNGDGYADVVVGQPGRNRSFIWHGGPARLGAPGTTSNASWRVEGHPGSAFGSEVAAAGDVNGDGYADVIVGAPARSGSAHREGEAYVYLGGPDNLSPNPGWSRHGGQHGAGFGWSVAGVGDVNGDGYADLAVGAPDYDRSAEDEGAVFVWHGLPAGPVGAAAPAWSAYGGQAGARLGASVAGAGDVDGDGHADVIAGAPGFTDGQAAEGAAFVWLGGHEGLRNDGAGAVAGASWRAESNQPGAALGAAVSGAGDVNGDGFADVAVGAKAYDDSRTDEGAVFVWHGALGGLGENGSPDNADWRQLGGAPSLGLGVSVSAAGDVDWDGYDDLVAGGTNLAAVWLGSSNGLDPGGPAWLRAGAQPTSMYGFSVSGGGDINGDGYADILVGAPLHSGGAQFEGAAWAYCGGPHGPSTAACWTDLGGAVLAAFGWSVAVAGDLNGDGYADLAVGAPGWSNGHEAEGQARVYYGSAWAPVSYNGGDWARESNSPLANMGYAVAGAGDVTGDGYAALLVGAPRLPNGGATEGALLLYHGNGRPGRPVGLRQLWPGGSTAIAPGGRSNSQSAFDLAVLAASPWGRGKVRVTQEVKALQQPFDGAMQLNPVWRDSGTSGYQHRETVTGLATETAYHWRARVQHDAVTSPFAPPFGRWLHVPWGGWNQTDLRTSGVGRYVVNSSADDAQTHDFHPGDGACVDYRGSCSLRAALEEANAHPGPDEITFLQPMEIRIDAGQGALPTVREALVVDAGPQWDTVAGKPGVAINGGGGSFDGLRLAADVCAVHGLYVTNFGGDGLRVDSAGNSIGGPLAGQGNVLSGNAGAGVHLSGAAARGNRVQGNRIGLRPDGTAAQGNGTGVAIGFGAAENTIGGTGPGDGNVISGNLYDGLSISSAGTDRNRVVGNAIGRAGTGSGVVGNGRHGISVAHGPHGTFIGEGSGHGNTVTGSGETGIYVNGASRTFIIKALVVGNTRHGVQLNESADGLVVWSTVSGNGADGVRVSGPASIRNAVGMNSIHANTGKGIAVTHGANSGIAAPSIAGGSVLGVSGRACPGCSVQISSDDEDEGRLLHGVVHADPQSGDWTLMTALAGPNVTALATDADGNTSEFSPPFAVAGGNTMVVDDPGDGPDAHDDDPGDGLCRAMVGGCTLRAAVEESNALPTRDRITFREAMTITLDTGLTEPLVVRDEVTIDAGGVWDVAGDAPGVRLDGTGSVPVLLVLQADDCAVYGLHLTGAFQDGIRITGAKNRVGGPGAGQRNVVTNCRRGITVQGGGAWGNSVRGNHVGLAAGGTRADGNMDGIRIQDGASSTTVGGAAPGEGNVVSGNDGAGIAIVGLGTSDTRLDGNLVGLGADALSPLPNGGAGVSIADGAELVYVGGLAPNTIASNTQHGVHVSQAGAGVTVHENRIAGNGWSGVGIDVTAGCLVGGNEIADNAEAGVNVHGGTAAGNAIRRNRIHGNGVRGIRLLNGANADIEPPVVSAAGPGGARGTACAACVVEVFSDAAGQGRTWHGAVAADGSGAWSYSGALAGPYVTATQTDADGNTSQFSAPVSVAPTAVPTPTDAPTATDGPTATATPTATDGPTATASPSGTALPPPTAGPSPTPTRTVTAGPSPTDSGTGTATVTAGPSPTHSGTGTAVTATASPHPDVTPAPPAAGRAYLPCLAKRWPLRQRSTPAVQTGR